jgi:hypothetical protein
MQDIFYDFTSEVKDPRFPRSNYITQADLERRFKGADLHSLAANVRYRTDCAFCLSIVYTKSGLPILSCETFLQAKMLKDTVYSEEYQMGNASTSVQSSSQNNPCTT